ncbi:MAG: translation initiation factor IF-3 [Betaproteobacteria bacterium AqS2]|uniref:Translation initiation factor IF-3 n=1 Tax=Candidatus Amphirhobacter heronislandensis TaxID=1732024 RepID=A0A930UD55_9GAMM|nr:translation initiation factor IF-3 [Betaproteobacteria bacterium AqS2]
MVVESSPDGTRIHQALNTTAKQQQRINEQIEAKHVLLIDEKGDKHGVMPVADALAIAQERKLDLVEVAPNGKPIVCKLLDYGRHVYREKKKRNEARSRQKQTATKMVKFRPNTFKGDYATKLGRIRRFLRQGDKVKVVMMFRGREIIHINHGFETFERLLADLAEDGAADSKPAVEGRFIQMTVLPLPGRRQAAAANGGAAAADEDGAAAA